MRGIKIIIKQYLISSGKRIVIIKFLSSEESCHWFRIERTLIVYITYGVAREQSRDEDADSWESL